MVWNIKLSKHVDALIPVLNNQWIVFARLIIGNIASIDEITYNNTYPLWMKQCTGKSWLSIFTHHNIPVFAMNDIYSKINIYNGAENLYQTLWFCIENVISPIQRGYCMIHYTETIPDLLLIPSVLEYRYPPVAHMKLLNMIEQ